MAFDQHLKSPKRINSKANPTRTAMTPRYPTAAYELTKSLRYFPKLRLAIEYAQTLAEASPFALQTMPVFAMDISDKNAAKKYMVGGWPALCHEILRRTKCGLSYFYEILQPGVPLRLYFDLDFPQVEGTNGTGALDRCVAHIIEGATEEFAAGVTLADGSTCRGALLEVLQPAADSHGGAYY